MKVRAALVALLVLAAVLRFAHLGASIPLAVETTNAPALDAFWYLEKASSAADGVRFEASPAYDLEPWCALARLWFLAFGSGYESACALGAAVGTATVLLVFALARPLGDRVALAAAAQLAVLYPFAQQGRTPLIYGFVALAMTGAALLVARGGRIGAAAGWLVALALPVLLKAPAAALVGGLAVAQLLRVRPGLRVRGALALAGLAGAGLLLVFLLDPLGAWTLNVERLRNYKGDLSTAALVERALRLGGAIAELSPGVVVLGALGWAVAWADLGRLPAAARDVLALAAGWTGTFALAALPLEYRPIRYHVPVLPAVAVLAGYALVRLVEGGPAARDVPAGPPPGLPPTARRAAGIAFAGVYGAVLGAHALGLVLAPLRAALSPTLLVGGAAAGALLAVVAVLLRFVPGRRAERLAAAALVPLLALDLLRDVDALRHVEESTAEARALARRIVPREAVLGGPYASVLAIGTPLERRRAGRLGSVDATPAELAATLRRLGYTHFAADVEQSRRFGLEGRLRAAGAAPLLVGVFYVRKEPVFVYRFAWAGELGCGETSFERARRIEDAEGLAAARSALVAAGALEERSLAFLHVRCLVHAGRAAEAAAAAREAFAAMPHDAALARLVIDSDALAVAAEAATASVGSPSRN